MNTEHDMNTAPQSAPAAHTPTAADAAMRINTSQLFRGQKTVEIDHGEQRYTLRVTKDNKLILTK